MAADGKGIMHHLDRVTPDGQGRVTLARVLEDLGDLAYPALLLMAAGINAIPALPGTTGLLGIPLIVLAAQRALGFGVVLPGFIRNRGMEGARFDALKERARPWLDAAERKIHPRWPWMSHPVAARILDWYVLLLALAVLAPLPLTAMLPAISICLIALGRLERDGIFIAVGIVAGLLAIGITAGLMIGIIAAMIALLG